MRLHEIWWIMCLFGPMIGQLAPIHHCLLEESKWENKLFFFTQDWVLSLNVNWFQMIRKLSSVYVLAHSGFVIRCCPTNPEFVQFCTKHKAQSN